MAYNIDIEKRISPIVSRWENTELKKMFGGICYLLKGNMVCGIYKDFLILRLGEANAEKHLADRHVRPFDITGRPMKGWIMIAPEGFKKEAHLKKWLREAKNFAETLPQK